MKNRFGCHLWCFFFGTCLFHTTAFGITSSAESDWFQLNLFVSYENWLVQHFSEAQLLDESISGENADPDGDKLTNGFEFHANYDPWIPDSRFHFYSNPARPRTLFLGPLLDSVDYRIEKSTDLVFWDDLDVDEIFVTDSREHEIIYFDIPSPVFFRVLLSDEE